VSILFVVLGLDNLVDILGELENDLVLLLCLCFLAKQVDLKLVDLALLLDQLAASIVHQLHLLLELFL